MAVKLSIIMVCFIWNFITRTNWNVCNAFAEEVYTIFHNHNRGQQIIKVWCSIIDCQITNCNDLIFSYHFVYCRCLCIIIHRGLYIHISSILNHFQGELRCKTDYRSPINVTMLWKWHGFPSWSCTLHVLYIVMVIMCTTCPNNK